MSSTDTIVALSTPRGRSGIGVVRLSGPGSLSILQTLVNDSGFKPASHRSTLKNIYEVETGDVLDRAIISYFRAPHSFTGEDVVELSCHGSPVLLRQVIDASQRLGARIAEPGEFTLRALKHGRLNLSQAEAIRDLIDARTKAAAKLAARQLGGEISRRLQPYKEELLSVIVPLESALEFVEEDLPEFATRALSSRLDNLATYIQDFASTFDAGRLLRDGLRITFAGKPNVGKSSLFNRLLGIDRAIVTDLAGTTRDSLSEVVSFDGVPVVLTDTAGLRGSVDRIEILGVQRTHLAVADADLVILVLDGTEQLTGEDHEVFSAARSKPHVVALNKSDLEDFDLAHVSSVQASGYAVVPVSAKTGAGLDLLRTAILSKFSAEDVENAGFMITDARHYDLLGRAAASINSSARLIRDGVSEELVLVGLYDALRLLGEITGETTPDEVLGRIFATFCIGK